MQNKNGTFDTTSANKIPLHTVYNASNNVTSFERQNNSINNPRLSSQTNQAQQNEMCFERPQNSVFNAYENSNNSKPSIDSTKLSPRPTLNWMYSNMPVNGKRYMLKSLIDYFGSHNDVDEKQDLESSDNLKFAPIPIVRELVKNTEKEDLIIQKDDETQIALKKKEYILALKKKEYLMAIKEKEYLIAEKEKDDLIALKKKEYLMAIKEKDDLLAKKGNGDLMKRQRDFVEKKEPRDLMAIKEKEEVKK